MYFQNVHKERGAFETALEDLRGRLKGIDHQWLADHARLSKVTVTNLVSGKTRSPHARTIFDIETALGLHKFALLKTTTPVLSERRKTRAKHYGRKTLRVITATRRAIGRR